MAIIERRRDILGPNFKAFITVTFPSGSICTLLKDGSVEGTASTSPYTFTVHSAGTYTLTATDGSQSDTQNVVISTSGQSESVTLAYTVTLNITEIGSITPYYTEICSYLEIDGVQYDQISSLQVRANTNVYIYGKKSYDNLKVKLNNVIVGEEATSRTDFSLMYTYVITQNSNIDLKKGGTGTGKTFYVKIDTI